MSTSAEQRAETLFYEAIELPASARDGFLDHACGADAGLRAEVDDLLRMHDGAAGFLQVDAPASPGLETEFGRLKPEQVGDRIGNYKLLEQIGEGGFGTVWVAEQERPMRRRVALKIIKLGMDTKEVIARFEQERQALAMMDHPNIAKVLDAGATPTGRPYFVMELVRGIKITEYCDQANLPTAERLRLFIAVCHAVQHAHQKGIIHRDLKPSNILVTLHDGVPVPKVIDFGVAKATQQQRLTDLTVYTQFEQMVGTPLYMSPEQAEMSGLDIDTRSDIYSLGVLLYELLVGRTPFDPEALMKRGLDEIRRAVREQEPQRPSTYVSTMALDLRTNLAQRRQTDSAKLIGQIRGDLDWIVMKALEKDRARRYETATGLAQDIQRHLLSEPVQARPPTQLYRFRRFAKRNKVAFFAGASIAAALIAGVAISTWQAFRANAALADLRASAPAFAAMSRTLVAKEQFDQAIEKLEVAIKLRPDVAEYVLAKADLLEGQFRFAEAATAYRKALGVNPGEQRAETNAALCEKLEKESAARATLPRESLMELFNTMTKEPVPVGWHLRRSGGSQGSAPPRPDCGQRRTIFPWHPLVTHSGKRSPPIPLGICSRQDVLMIRQVFTAAGSCAGSWRREGTRSRLLDRPSRPSNPRCAGKGLLAHCVWINPETAREKSADSRDFGIEAHGSKVAEESRKTGDLNVPKNDTGASFAPAGAMGFSFSLPGVPLVPRFTPG